MFRLADEQDDDLVLAAGRGDRAAFARLVTRHAPRLGALAARVTGDMSAGEDVVQETFARAWLKTPTWRPGPAPYGAWLTRVAVNLSIDHRRKVIPLRLDDIAEPPDPAPDAQAALERNERFAALRAAMAALPPRQRAALALTYDLDLSNAEAAAALETSIGALELLLVRARRTLRETLTSKGDGHDT